jgi:hypothetical protein
MKVDKTGNCASDVPNSATANRASGKMPSDLSTPSSGDLAISGTQQIFI